MNNEQVKRIIRDLQIDVFSVIKRIEVGRINPAEACGEVAKIFMDAEQLAK